MALLATPVFYKKTGGPVNNLIQKVPKNLVSKDEPNKIVAARCSAPLIVGLSQDGNFLASDALALAEYTRKVVYLGDNEIAVLTLNSFSFLDLKNNRKQKTVDKIDWDVEKAQKCGFSHFMLKEIFQKQKE